MLSHVDAYLRRHCASLDCETLHDCWRDLIKIFPGRAGIVQSLEQYLVSKGLITDGRRATALPQSLALSDQYVIHLREVRGFTASTISRHQRVAECFLHYLKERGTAVGRLKASDIDSYITTVGKRLSRATLQHEIAALRGFLRFVTTVGAMPAGLSYPIDTPRLYRLEKLPRALPWETVRRLLRSIETKSAKGLRDYAMFLLIATYGLRASEIVTLTLDDIRWREGILRIHQTKTASPLELPLTNEVSSALVKHLKRTPPPPPHRTVFLRMRAPIGVLKRYAVKGAFEALVRKSGFRVPYQGPHCLRHSYAVHLLKIGTPLKTIGDILGHRTAESTGMYLRLATGDLREVPLPVPGRKMRKEVQR